MPDIFDEVSESKRDIFDEVSLTPKEDIFDQVSKHDTATLDQGRLAAVSQGVPEPNKVAIEPELSRTAQTLVKSEAAPEAIYATRGLRQAKEEEQGYKDFLADRWRNSWTTSGLKRGATEVLGIPMRAVSTVEKAVGLPTETPAQIPHYPPKEQRWAQIAAGGLNMGIDFMNFFLTPDGVASLGIGGLTKPAQEIALTMIGGEMALTAPDQYNAAITAAEQGDWQQATEQTLGFMANSGLGAHLIKKGTLPDKPQFKVAPKEYKAYEMPPEATEIGRPLETSKGDISIIHPDHPDYIPLNEVMEMAKRDGITEQQILEHAKKISQTSRGGFDELPSPLSQAWAIDKAARRLLTDKDISFGGLDIDTAETPADIQSLADKLYLQWPIEKKAEMEARNTAAMNKLPFLAGTEPKTVEPPQVVAPSAQGEAPPEVAAAEPTQLTHPILGMTEKELSLASLRTLKARNPQKWEQVTKVFGVQKVNDVARLAKQRFEQMRHKPAASTPTEPLVAMEEAQQQVSDAPTKRDAKEVKSELIDRLEKAIKDAPAEETISPSLRKYREESKTSKFSNQRARAEESVARELTTQEVPKVTIEIPGDGTFTVWKTKEALTELLTRAKKLNTASTIAPSIRKSALPTREQGKQWLSEVMGGESKGIAASAREKLSEPNQEAFINPAAAAQVIQEDWAPTVRAVAGHTMPKTTARNREVGESGARYLSSKIAAPYKAMLFVQKVLASGVDAFKFGAALVEDNLRSIKDYFQREGNTEAADAVHSLIGGERSPFRTEAEYQAFFADPITQDAIRRHKSLWDEDIESQYKAAQGIDPDVELPSRGLQTGARINLKALVEGERGTRPITASRGSLLSTFKKKSPFGREAKGTGQSYETDYNEIISNTYAKQLEIANQNLFNKMLVENGLAVVSQKPPVSVAGEAPSRAYPLQRRLILSDGRAFAKNENLYLPKSLEGEYRRAVNVDAPTEIPGLQPVINLLNKASLISIGEATGHAWNLADALFNLPKGHPIVDALLKVSGRADMWPTLYKVLRKSLSNNTQQLSELAEIGALKEPFKGLGPLNAGIKWADKTVRLILDDAYKQLADQGLVDRTETARREFINQVGQYNKRAQGPLMRLLRDTGIGPFATAGRAFNVLGVRRLLLDPGIKAKSPAAFFALRANMLAGIVGIFVLRGLMNYMLSGNTNGRPGTKLMEIDLGSDDKNGHPRRFPIGDLLGPGRGLRVTGLGGAIESKRAGLERGAQFDSGFRQAATALLSPAWGPMLRFLSTALAGRSTVFAPQVAPQAKPNQSQYALNVATAAKEANPFIATASDIVQGEGINWQKLAGRVSPLPGMTQERYQALPEIVKKAKLRDYKDWLVHEMNKLPQDKREEFFNKHSQGVEFTARDIREIRARTKH